MKYSTKYSDAIHILAYIHLFKGTSLLDIYASVEKDHHLLHADKKTNPNCLIGGNIQTVLEETYDVLQKKIEQEMSAISLQSIIDGIQIEANH